MNHLRHTHESFDRLVDGELSESQRTEMLKSLDQEPDGWRHCALAFLEAQCWRKELGGLRQSMPADEAPLSSAVAPSPRPSRRRSSPFGFAGTLTAMAATFLLFLGAGVLWQHSGNSLGNFFGAAGSNQIASNKDGRSTAPSGAQTAVAQNDSQSKNASAPWQWVRLSPAGSANPGESVRVPALERNRMDQQWLQSLPSPIPENMVQALERSGYQVQRQQELMPMPLKDGRQLVVPVDKVQLQYVGNPTY
jgi:hypothetical protein